MDRSESFTNLNPNKNNDNGSSNTAFNLISSINTNTTHIADSTTASGSSLTTSTSNSPNNDNNDQQQQQQQAYMEHVAQYNKIQSTFARGQFIDPRYTNAVIDGQMNILPAQTAQPTTAFLVQTANGSALLIPPANNFHTLNSFSLSRQNYMTTSPSVTSGAFRPDSNLSQNVYQTIDAEKNAYLYPLDAAYDSSTTFTNTCSTKSKFKKSFQHQQHAHLTKLIENSHHTARSNSNGYFSSPTESNMSARNRRHLNGSILERFKFSFSKKLEKVASWKCLSLVFLIIILNLFLFTIYLAVMKKYNLNWHLKDQNSHLVQVAERKPINLMLFTKIGDTIEDQIEPNELFNMQFYLDTSSYIKFNLSISAKSQIGFYADKGTPPTFTKFKIFETFNSNSVISEQNKNLVNTGFVHYLDQGLWYISILNDNKFSIKFALKTQFHSQLVSGCENNCFGKGDCINNKCECYPGYTGSDCSQTKCPVLCNGHGKYENGRCNCETQWHGDECEIPIDQCEVKDCNQNGECMNGVCMCFQGYAGKFCDTKTCQVADCSNNGVCINGVCKCFFNFTGFDCSQQQVELTTTNLCSSNGWFNYETKSCQCFQNWNGPDCSLNQNCLNRECSMCKSGWSGEKCMKKSPLGCDSRCSAHGLCINGTCSCSPGYQGRNCDIDSCPNGCSSNGICEMLSNNGYHCVCNPGWTGKACDVRIELVCNDDIDNDGDGLTDCMDSECCVYDNCKLSLACQSAPEPKDRLLRKQPPSISASFFDKMRFLIEDSSVQSFAYSNSFIESQVSVIRGQVLFKNGQPLIGVKVTTFKNPIYGYTLTRNNGIFDIMVNGGGSVQLEFNRNRLKTRVITVNTAWNQFVHIDPVTMYLNEDLNEEQAENTCSFVSKPILQFRPIVRTSWKEMHSSHETSSIIVPDTGVIRSEVELSEKNLKLVFSSNLVQGYSTSVFVRLTGNQIPNELQIVHLEITIEGVLHKEKFNAYPNLNYEYSWDRRNAYEQRVYGMTIAKVRVGYQYEFCTVIDWQTQTVKIAGYDLGSSEIGNWNLNIHHRLNTQLGILHKGDGSTVYLGELQKSIQHVLKLDSEGIYLDINKDGTLLIADSNFVWMMNSTDQPRKIFAHYMNKLYMASDPIDGLLYLNNQGEKKIISIKSMDKFVQETRFNYKTDLDGLMYPKGLAFDNNKNLFFIDSNSVKVFKNGIVKDVIASGQRDSPVECKQVFDLNNKFGLYWPTVLAINPIDNSLYILDDGIVYKLGTFGTLQVIAGKPFFCADDNPNFVKLYNPIDMAFSPDGELFILENDAKNKIHQIRLVKSTGQIQVYFTNLHNPKSIRVHQNRSIYVLDSSNLFQIKNTVVKDEYTGKYTVVSTQAKEAYIFNRFGLHLNTIDIRSGHSLYNFTYNGNALYGKLIQVSDQNRILMNIKRDFHGRADMLQLSDQIYELKLNNFNMIRSLAQADKTIKFNYLGNSGLLASRVQIGSNSYFFKYQKSGKVKEIVENVGSKNITLGFDYDLTEQGLITNVIRASGGVETWLTNSSGLFIFDSNKKILEYKYDFNINYKTVLYDDLVSLF